jgi:hypothetical protein
LADKAYFHAKLRAGTHEAPDYQKSSTHKVYLVKIPEHLFLSIFVRVLRRCIAKGTQSYKCYLSYFGEGMVALCSIFYLLHIVNFKVGQRFLLFYSDFVK